MKLMECGRVFKSGFSMAMAGLIADFALTSLPDVRKTEPQPRLPTLHPCYRGGVPTGGALDKRGFRMRRADVGAWLCVRLIRPADWRLSDKEKRRGRRKVESFYVSFE